jgi:two-component system phosphate regulon sensor histidine kinase PhoR
MNNSPFPWHYYIREVRARIFFIILTALSVFIAHKLYPTEPFAKIIIIIISLILLSFIVGYLRVLPFRKILNRIDNIQIKLPHDKKLDLIYQKDEWTLIQEILSYTENHLVNQNEEIKKQGMESDTLVESIPSGLVIVDKYQSCKKYNSIFKEQFITSENDQQISEIKLWKIFDEQELLSSFSAVVQSRDQVKLNGFHLRSENKYFDIAINPLFDSKMNLTGALGIFHDVTISKLTEKMRVDFVANVSHEIRTPLTSIMGYTQLLEASNQTFSDDQKSINQKILSNSERLKDLFDNLLKLSVIESQNQIQKENFSANGIFKQITNSLKGKYLNKNIDINLIEKDIDLFGDFKLLEQVFTNLFDNAIKYGDKDVIIDISTGEKDNITNIIIKDNGPGISEVDQKRIFERFYRVQGSNLDIIDGTGLGLSIVKHIINKHNGTISVESELGEGSTFTIHIPQL